MSVTRAAVVGLGLVLAACGSSTATVMDSGVPDSGVGGGGGMAGGSGGGGGVGAGGGAGGGSGGGIGGGSGGGVGGGGSSLQGGDTCAQAPDVSAGGTFAGQSTETAVDDYAPSGSGCPTGGAASGRDVAYLLQPAVATSYTVRVTPLASSPSFDPMLYAVSTCGGVGCLAGTVLNGPGQPEEIALTVGAGQTAYVIVDGELASRGAFELQVIAQ
jgi:hypothetical protein